MKKLLVIFGLPPVIGVVGALFTEYVLKIGVLGSVNLKYFLGVGVVAAVFVAIFAAKRVGTLIGAFAFAVSTVIGFALIPYFAFLVGQIDIYMVDDNLAEGVTVLEVRPVMEKIVFGTPNNGEVPVWSGPQTLTLYPGENRVKLGRFAMPAGTYSGGKVYIDDIQVDIQMDLATMKNPADGQAIPADYYEQTFELIKSSFGGGSVGGFTTTLLQSSLSGNIADFTISVGSMTLPIPIPEIQYPGVGGPDVTVDIILDEMGRPDPSKIRTIIEMPPGFAGAFPPMPGVEFK